MAPRLNKLASWNRAHDRLVPETWPELKPSFTLPIKAKIMTFGSCFARNIETNLTKLGFDVPTSRATMPVAEWASTDNQFLNRYTPASILTEVETADKHLQHDNGYDPDVSARYMIPIANGKVVDSQFPGFVPVSETRFHERRKELLELTKHAFDADCVTITLGLIETFYDTEQDIYLCAAPNGQLKRLSQDRFELKTLTFLESYEMVRKAIEIIRRRNPDVKILITTSPIALTRTFSEDDVIIANCYSKSVLRAICGQLSSEIPKTDYFPSYESATITKSWDIYDPDMLHLSKSFVSKIVSRLVDYYFTEVPPAAVSYQRSFAAFQERDYETARQEIEKAIELEPESAETQAHAGMVARSLGETAVAAQYFKRAADLRPDADTLSNLAMALLKLAKIDEAFEAVNNAIKLEPTRQSLRLQRASLLVRIEDLSAAEKEVDFVLAENPRNVHAVIQKLAILERQEDTPGIIDVAKAALRDVGGGHKDRMRAYLAKAYLETGEIDQAKLYYSSAQAGSKFFRGFDVELEKVETLSATS